MCIQICEYFVGPSSSAALTIIASQGSTLANVSVRMIAGSSLTGVNTSAANGVCPMAQVTRYRYSFHIDPAVVQTDMNIVLQRIDAVVSAWLPHAQMR